MFAISLAANFELPALVTACFDGAGFERRMNLMTGRLDIVCSECDMLLAYVMAPCLLGGRCETFRLQ